MYKVVQTQKNAWQGEKPWQAHWSPSVDHEVLMDEMKVKKQAVTGV